MNSLELKARAKINLSLDVLGKRPDGYHLVRMIMQTVELHDKIVLETIPGGIEIACSCPGVPPGTENIVYKAARLLQKECKIKKGIRIKIKKNIPIAAGLGGGSSNAAAVLKGMNAIFSLGLQQAELMKLGAEIGADVPYCIKGGTALAEGIGEILTGLGTFKGVNIVLVKPKIKVSTAWVYNNLDLAAVQSRPDTQALIKAILSKRIADVASNMKNVLEVVTARRFAVIEEIKGRLIELGALGSVMTGSGPSVFGVFGDFESAQKAYYAVKNQGEWDCFLTCTV
jgi:4-diphosphocytidyl-2-C-methyl-D-erythritol kinase